MRMRVAFVYFLLAGLCGCSQNPTPVPGRPEFPPDVIAWPKEWSELVGKRVTLEGKASNAKLGALLNGKEDMIWIEGLRSWPEDFYSVGEGKRLRVTGTVIRKDDLPVFVPKPGELPRAGIPVATEEELEKAKWRYLLNDAKWAVLD